MQQLAGIFLLDLTRK